MENKLKLRQFRKKYKPEQTLFSQGDRGDKFYIIREGTVEICREENGEQIKIATVGSGEILGEMALLGNISERSATARAKTQVNSLEFSKKQLDKLIEERPAFRERVIRLLCQRIASTNEKLSNYQKYDFHFHQTALMLLHYVEENDLYGETTEITLTPEQVDLLKLLDLSPGDLEDFLSTTSKKKLSQMNPEEQDKLREITFTVLEKVLRKIEINTEHD